MSFPSGVQSSGRPHRSHSNRVEPLLVDVRKILAQSQNATWVPSREIAANTSAFALRVRALSLPLTRFLIQTSKLPARSERYTNLVPSLETEGRWLVARSCVI